MDIIKPDQDGRPPWSPTVVNIMRGRKKKQSRALVILIIVMLVISFSCIIVGTQINKPKTKASLPTPTPTATDFVVAKITILPTPRIRWTPMPDNPLIKYRIEPLKKP